MTLAELRQHHPRFIYRSYQAELQGTELTLTFTYLLEPNLEFQGKVTVHNVDQKRWAEMPQELKDAWVFHIGLAEIPSYWKAAAPSEIVVEAGQLTSEQLAWWHKLLINGMGEFFYVNQIDFTAPEFVQWRVGQSSGQSVANPSTLSRSSLDWNFQPSQKYLVPVGGGKDSTLTMALFNEHHHQFGVFLLNPTPAASQVTEIAHPTETITASRVIDPKLVALRDEGYLNGHVPFSAYLAFLSRFVGLLFGYESVVISNERSSNEGNVEFLGRDINHQYSKTFEFERGFENYVHDADLVPENLKPSFFSLMRPLYEVQISRLLARSRTFNDYSYSFRSCNRGQKTNSWCGECPKCLFTFVSLYPYLSENYVSEIFGQNLFENPNLINDARALMGFSDAKPFECVGTHEENIIAFYLCIQASKNHTMRGVLPPLLQLVWDEILVHQTNLDVRAEAILTAWNTEHQVPVELADMLLYATQST